jgi:hypothetical protein
VKAVIYAAVMASILSCSAAWAIGPFPTRYDDFSAPSGLIKPARWLGFEVSGLGTETLRAVESGALHLFLRGYGNTTSDSKRTTSSQGLMLAKNPNTITAIQADVQVNTVQASDCAANPYPKSTAADVILQGNFFNAGIPSPTSGQTDDVVAQIYIGRSAIDAAGILQVQAQVFHCTNPTCSTNTTIGVVQSLGTTVVAQVETLLMQWDKTNHRFLFQRGSNPQTEVDYGGIVTDAAAPNLPLMQVRAFTGVENCTSQRQRANIDATIDNVFVAP